jgi:tetratricopeptide (TPR) repeat protein
LLAVALAALAAAAGWWLLQNDKGRDSGSVPLPEIPISSLGSNAASTIRKQMDNVRGSPESGAAWGKLGMMLKSYGFREQAGKCLEEAERLEPSEPRWAYLQATLQNREATAVAIAKLRRTIVLGGNEPEMPRLRLAQLLAEAGDEDQAREELRQLLATRPDCGPARLLMAHLSRERGEWAEATAMAMSCTTNPYTARAAWTLLAALHRRHDDTNAAQLASRRAAAVSPDVAWPDPYEDEVTAWRDDARSLSDRAQAHLMAGRAADALPLVHQLAREHPQFAETWLLLGRAQFLQKQPVAAERSLRRFLTTDPGSVNGHFQLGMCLLAQKRYTEAVATFQHTTTLKRDFGPAFFNLGFALAKSGKQREAIPAFKEAIRHNPEMIEAYVLLADLHLQFGEKAEAAALAQLADRLDPADQRLALLRQKIQQH